MTHLLLHLLRIHFRSQSFQFEHVCCGFTGFFSLAFVMKIHRIGSMDGNNQTRKYVKRKWRQTTARTEGQTARRHQTCVTGGVLFYTTYLGEVVKTFYVVNLQQMNFFFTLLCFKRAHSKPVTLKKTEKSLENIQKKISN